MNTMNTKHIGERVSHAAFAACAAFLVLAMLAIFFFVGANAYQIFTVKHVNPFDFFFGTSWFPTSGETGALVMIVGSISVTALAVLVSAPVSVGLAVFVTEVAPPWVRRIMQPVFELFLGIPSIIYGLLALQILVPAIAYAYNYLAGAYLYNGFGLIAAALVLAIMIMPTITTIAIDAVRALPVGLREASLALGATRWQTIRSTLLPAASPGIFTGIVLGMGRAIGETLAISFVIGASPNSFPFHFTNVFPYIAFTPTSAITVQLLFDFAEATPGSLNYDAVWTLSFVLLVIALLLVILSRWIGSRSAYGNRDAGRGEARTRFRDSVRNTIRDKFALLRGAQARSTAQ
jgi:phosphate transport system permease protein